MKAGSAEAAAEAASEADTVDWAADSVAVMKSASTCTIDDSLTSTDINDTLVYNDYVSFFTLCCLSRINIKLLTRHFVKTGITLSFASVICVGVFEVELYSVENENNFSDRAYYIYS